MFDDEVGRYTGLLAAVIDVSQVPYSEVAEWAELKPESLDRIVKGQDEIPIRTLLLILECVTFDFGDFLAIGSMLRDSGTPWRQQVLDELKAIGYESVVFRRE
jgi:hypothetical protein